ncbi:MAG TPA: hypothetical protein VKZ87_03165 [Ferrovibrio sp.]|uniref:hypothetical protein n=1 Tax=Ferrovibrio sp. TaxID=1917215 RepID=UPI002B4B38AA|nr:hypothetical protein [Ferrovibrio sp.]HLT76365.1 hypothetical protein [Ferrovibrio sp.]
MDEEQRKPELWTGNSQLFQAALNQTERYWAVQQRLTNIYGNFLSHWLQRRQRAAETALDTTKKILSSNGDAAKIPTFCEEWLKGSWERVAADMRECQECMGEAAQVVQNGLVEAPQSTAKEHQKAKA